MTRFTSHQIAQAVAHYTSLGGEFTDYPSMVKFAQTLWPNIPLEELTDMVHQFPSSEEV
jgi:hypothetical protein